MNIKKACILENLAYFVHVNEEQVSLSKQFLFKFLIITIFIWAFKFFKIVLSNFTVLHLIFCEIKLGHLEVID